MLCVPVVQPWFSVALAHHQAAVHFEGRYPDDATMLALLDEYDATYRAYLEHRGATPRDWSAIMTGKFAEPRRAELGAYYRGKGAELE